MLPFMYSSLAGVKFLLEDEAVQVGGSNHSHGTQARVWACATAIAALRLQPRLVQRALRLPQVRVQSLGC